MASTNIKLPSEGAHSIEHDHATATCFCGTVQINFPVTKEAGLYDTFVCNCADCRKITASMFASNFIVTAAGTQHVRGQDKLSKWSQNRTIESGNTMSNFFCSVCGTLMYRISSGFPDMLITRIGTVDDYKLQETVLKPRVEQYTKDRVAWFHGAEGAEQVEGGYYK